MGGKSSDNSEMIDLQNKQAEEARAKEVARQARLDKGMAGIKAAFEGSPEMRAQKYDWSGFDPNKTKAGSVVPGMAGYTFVNQPAVAATAGRPAGFVPGTGDGVPVSHQGTGNVRSAGVMQPAVAATAAQPGGWMIKGPDGKLHPVGEDFTANVATGKTTGGFGSDFFNKLRSGIVDYFMPQVAGQYKDAVADTTYGLARAGTLNSSAGAEAKAKIDEQNALNRADVYAQSDTAAADLKSRIASERAKAEGQLYATENPTAAINQGLAAVKNISLDKPNLTPLGEIFKVAAIGGANALGGYKSEVARRDFLNKTGTKVYS